MVDTSKLNEKMLYAEKYCLSPEGCPKLRGVTDYNERLSKCAGCTNILNKIDLVELLRELYNNTPTSSHSSTFKGKGKSTQLSKAQIKEILEMKDAGYSLTSIGKELKIEFRTVKNVVNKSFKNEYANRKVAEVEKELEDL